MKTMVIENGRYDAALRRGRQGFYRRGSRFSARNLYGRATSSGWLPSQVLAIDAAQAGQRHLDL